MRNLKVSDVRALTADSAFLIDDGKTAILCDTGFAFTGDKIAENVKRELGGRELDYIFLTHSHYDHALGTPYILKHYPNAKVVAGAYAKKIFDKPSAKHIMRELDMKFARTCGVMEYEDLVDDLKVDIVVNDGDCITCGDMEFTAIELPGHTNCSVGFYLKENKLLLATETLGVYFGNGLYLPSFLVGFQMTLDSFKKAHQLDIESILVPHYGLVEHDQAKSFLEHSENFSIEIAEKVKAILSSGGSREDAVEYVKERIYRDNVVPTYPIDAFYLNTGIMVDQVRKELM